MQVDFNRTFKSLTGETLKDENGKDVTLSAISQNALLAQYQDEQSLSGEDKAARYKLALKLNECGEIFVSAEDVSLLKKLIGKAYNALIVGQAIEMLEGVPENA